MDDYKEAIERFEEERLKGAIDFDNEKDACCQEGKKRDDEA